MRKILYKNVEEKIHSFPSDAVGLSVSEKWLCQKRIQYNQNAQEPQTGSLKKMPLPPSLLRRQSTRLMLQV